MPFGLCNAPQSMCRLMVKVIPYQLHCKVFVYLDDLLVISETLEEHLALLTEVASRLRQANLTINVEKSKFCLTYTRFLGFVVGGGRLQTDPEKVSAITSFPVPKTERHIRRFLGMAGWYSRFIPNFSTLAAPLTDLLGKKKFSWSPTCQNAFDDIKDKLTSSPVLTHPDYTKTFHIQCDASKTGVGSVLFQKDEDGFDHPIAYFSKKLNRAQRNYSVTELECYAAVLSVKKFREFVEGYEFIIITDHASLQWLRSQKDLSGRLARWSLKLQGYTFKIQYRKGKENVVPDALSRTFSSDDLIEKLLEEISLTDNAFKGPEYLNLIQQVTNLPLKSNLVVRNGKVYIKVNPNKLTDSDICYRLYVPTELISGILESNHNAPNASHLGIEKTVERIRRLYYWPKMWQTVKEYVNNCHQCKSSKPANYCTRSPMSNFHVTSIPWERIYIDFLGPYPRSKLGHTHLMIMIDHFTKFLILEPLRAATSETAIKTLNKRIFTLFGVPETLVSDNGSQFISHKFANFLNKLGIYHILTHKYSPQANAAERPNRTIIGAIRSYLGNDHRDWDTHLDEIGCAIRTANHDAIGVSPYYALFGRNIINHGGKYKLLRELQCLTEPDVELINPDTHAEKLRDLIQSHLQESFLKYENPYNLRSKKRSFEIGQNVYVRNFVQSNAANKFSAKLAPKFIKATLSEKIGTVAFRCTDESGKTLGVYHVKDIRV